MANVQPDRGAAPGAFQRGVDFLTGVNAELKKITWPTREELVETTKRITLLAVAVGVMIGLMDWVLQKILVDGVAALTR